MRPTLKSTAAAVFIGGCAAAGIAVASASTPSSHPAPSSSVESSASGATTSIEMRHHGRDLHQDLHRGRDAHQGGSAPDGTGSGSDDTLPPGVVPSPEPGDDLTSEPVEIPTVSGDDNEQSSEPGDDNDATDEPGDLNASSVPGGDDGDGGDSSGPGGSDSTSSDG